VSTAPNALRLNWREAKFFDRQKLRQWCCTWSKERIPGTDRWEWPAPWEARVQALFRESHPPVRNGHTLWLGFDAMGIAAAAMWRPEPPLTDGLFTLVAAAVASRHRGQGRVVSRLLVDQVLTYLEALASEAGAPELRVSAIVHRSNRASQRLCAEVGFECLGPSTDTAEADYDDWLLCRGLGIPSEAVDGASGGIA
jgi:hypothetical protein